MGVGGDLSEKLTVAGSHFPLLGRGWKEEEEQWTAFGRRGRLGGREGDKTEFAFKINLLLLKKDTVKIRYFIIRNCDLHLTDIVTNCILLLFCPGPVIVKISNFHCISFNGKSDRAFSNICGWNSQSPDPPHFPQRNNENGEWDDPLSLPVPFPFLFPFQKWGNGGGLSSRRGCVYRFPKFLSTNTENLSNLRLNTVL